MRLWDFFREVYLVERPIKDSTADQYRVGLKKFDGWNGSPVYLADLSDLMVSSFLKDAETWRWRGKPYAAKTIAGWRDSIVVVWRRAWKYDYCDSQPTERIRKVSVPPPIVTAWDLKELHSLLEAANRMGGYFDNGLPRGLYLSTLYRFCYETGFRRDDCLTIRWNAIDFKKLTVTRRQAKTEHPHTAQISPETADNLKAIRAILRANGSQNADTPFYWPHSWRSLSGWFDRCAKRAGVDATKKKFQRLRQTGASWSEREQPGSAQRYCGHMTPGLAMKHYVDPRIAGVPVSPPEVGPTVGLRIVGD